MIGLGKRFSFSLCVCAETHFLLNKPKTIQVQRTSCEGQRKKKGEEEGKFRQRIILRSLLKFSAFVHLLCPASVDGIVMQWRETIQATVARLIEACYSVFVNRLAY